METRYCGECMNYDECALLMGHSEDYDEATGCPEFEEKPWLKGV